MNKLRRTLQAKVVKVSNANTVSVSVENKQAHPLYKKVLKSHKKYLVHAANVEGLTAGDIVMIGETNPKSRRKSWEIISKVSATK
jgi:small subunit ribosomal protein S17